MMRPILFAIAALAPLAALALYPFGILIALSPLFVSHVFLLAATIVPNCQWWGPVVRCFDTSEREVWLTIDDGPSPEHTGRILELLSEHNARATFFVIGNRVEQHPHLLTEILTRGHAVANHTFTHPSATFWCAGPRTVAGEVDRCAATLRATPSRPAHFFRPPAGLTSPFIHPALGRRGLRLIGWSARGLDTVRRDAERIASSIRRKLKPGAIILMHESHHLKRDSQFGVACLELVLREISAAGYRCVIPAPEQLRTRVGETGTDGC